MRWAVTGLVAIGLVATLVVGLGSSGPARRAAPPLPATQLSGPRVTLASLRGRPAFINFWASWCGPCTKEIPQLVHFASRDAARAALVGVDWSDRPAAARRFVTEYGISYPVLVDRDNRTGARFGLVGLPTTYVLDARGRITTTLYGAQTVATLERALRAAEAG
jgi:thiol-disulfide isomerase/thioredoxin